MRSQVGCGPAASARVPPARDRRVESPHDRLSRCHLLACDASKLVALGSSPIGPRGRAESLQPTSRLADAIRQRRQQTGGDRPPPSASYLFAPLVGQREGGWDIGAFESDFTSSIKNDNRQPIRYKLFQNYPNPFNPSSNISFTLPVDSKVRIVVYNLLGEMVEELASDELSAGTHTFSFNADGLTSSVYFYRLEAGEFIAIKKMVLMK